MIGRWFKPYPSSLRLWSFFTIFCLDSVRRNEPTASSFFPTRDKTWSIRIQYVSSGRWQEGEEEEEEEEGGGGQGGEGGGGRIREDDHALFSQIHLLFKTLCYPTVKLSSSKIFYLDTPKTHLQLGIVDSVNFNRFGQNPVNSVNFNRFLPLFGLKPVDSVNFNRFWTSLKTIWYVS